MNISVKTELVKTSTILAVGSALTLVIWQKDRIFQQPLFKAESLFRNLSSFSSFFESRNRITDCILIAPFTSEACFYENNLDISQEPEQSTID